MNQPSLRKRPNSDINFNRVNQPKRNIEKILPLNISNSIEESKLYNQLVLAERKLDEKIGENRLTYLESSGVNSRVIRTLRLFISSQVSNQPDVNDLTSSTYDISGGSVPAWTLRIDGKLLPLPLNNSSNKSKSVNKPISSLIKSIVIELDRDCNLYPEGNLIEWNSINSTLPCDGFEIKRQGVIPVKCKIVLTLNHPTDRFHPSKELSEMLVNYDHKTLFTLAEINKLLEINLTPMILCDDILKKIFDCDKINIREVHTKLMIHLLPPGPIAIEYIINGGKDGNNAPYILDMKLEMEDELKMKLNSILTNQSTNRAIAALDDKINQNLVKLKNSRAKRDFMQKFALNPATFINQWVQSQAQDLEVIYGDNPINLEEMRRTELYHQDWIKEAMFHYIQSKANENLSNSALKDQ